ncbi:GGDEF domain-containing protein [Qipengyuania huizhouensis]|uniref:GGDEF domain-containing protein n=1 Tax=Qipengyuania huizhouensis TaxID=2867245 RepID=UPI001C885D42|nr:GGDEF domain-containing protein [Qipengyuania huizhouensis]MBX7460316.1 GGDEF domain-containing protein [Qipengyuania huizhouensis]
MQILVDLHLVVFGLLSALAAICVAVHIALKAGSALAWLAATLACVGAETLVFRYAAQSDAGIAAISLLVPLAYLCAGNAIRQSLKLEIANGRQLWVFAGLIGLSLLMIPAGAPIFYQCIPFQLAGVYIFYEAIRIQMRQRYRSLIDNALLLLCFCSMIGVAIRAPMFPLLLGEPTPFQVMNVDIFESIFINALSLLTSGLAILLVAKIVANVIALHKHRAEHDDLTGLLNRRMFDEVAKQVEEVAGSVVMCDIDRFKTVNDVHGHQVGDDVIRTFAFILTLYGDYAGRMGGEEFALLLVDTPQEEAALIAEAIRLEFHQFRHPAIGEEAALSASFGVASFGGGQNMKTAFQQADKALYRAKKRGRNQVCREETSSSVRSGLEKAA